MIREILFLIAVVGMIPFWPGFLNLRITDILNQITIWARGYLLHWSMFSNSRGLPALDAPPQCDIQKYLQALPSITQETKITYS